MCTFFEGLRRCDLTAGMQPLSYTGMFASVYDWTRKGQNVRLSRGASKNNLEDMVGFHSGEVERREGVRGHPRMNNQLKGNYKRYTYLQTI